MATVAEKFNEIARAIKTKTVLNNSNQDAVFNDEQYKISANDFASEIVFIDRLSPMTIYPNELDNNFIGNLVAKVAASYHCARILGKEDFVYNSNSLIFNKNPRLRDTSNSLTNKNDVSTVGQARIDCSTFVSLVLRGINYENSPYAAHPYDENDENRWTPANELPSMYGTYGWEFVWIDKQQAGEYKDIGFDGYTSLCTAADFGECFYKYGKVIYDRKEEGALTEETANNMLDRLKPGDLIFWSSPSATEKQKNRFRSISHIAIVAENPRKYFEVSGDSVGNVVLYDSFESTYENMSLICRPNYRFNKIMDDMPIGKNLLSYPWAFGLVQNYTEKGITIEIQDMNTLHVFGTATADCGIELTGHSSYDLFYLTLVPGTYQLSGMENTGVTTNSVSLQLRKSTDDNYSTTNIKCYAGNNPTFTLTENTNVYVRLYVAKDKSLDCDITPTLKRIS